MDIAADTLEELKCSSCEVYLSRGPVYLQYNGAAVCGRCYSPKCPATRNTQYEATAKLLKFPCRNQELGCTETVPFVNAEEVIEHEEVCEHRLYVCPVLGSAHCAWLGTRAAMLAHCRDRHPDHVLENPCTLTHDIARASLQTYMLTAFQLLFLLHTKVCVATGKIFHSVRFMGKSEEAARFYFNLDVKRGSGQLSREGQVAPQGCLAIQEPTSIDMDTNSLIAVLGGFDGTTFTVTVKQRVSDAAAVNCGECKAAVKCVECREEVTKILFCDEKGWRCERCLPAKEACANRKCYKHSTYFCQQSTKCWICGTAVSRGTLALHYTSNHLNITNRASCTWRVNKTKYSEWQYRLIPSAAGTAVCKYYLNDSQFVLEVHIPVSSERLKEFRCMTRVTDPATGHEHTVTPDVKSNLEVDSCRGKDKSRLKAAWRYRRPRHYTSKHQDVISRAGFTWWDKKSQNSQYRLISNAVGTAVCMLNLNDSHFVLEVHIPVSGERLKELCCVVRVTDPATGHEHAGCKVRL